MKTAKKVRPVERGGELKESTFGIQAGQEGHLFAILRDKLYSDKIMAVIREYSTNAVDAHVDAGKRDLPIKVEMPTRLSPELSIRDFGKGLSEDEIRELYVMYGTSTKRDTNDAVGQLGLGCKAGFAYGDQFMVISYFGGEKKTYNAYLDETDVGKIALMATEKTTEPDGVEIKIAVDTMHIRQFHEKAAHLFSFFAVTPDVRRLDPSFPIQKFKYWLEGELDNGVRWGLQEKNSSAEAIMGGIPYKIDRNQFEFGQRGNYVLDHGVHIWFRIGDLQMAASREALEYTKKTSKHIRIVIKDVIDKIAEAALKKVGAAKTYREACLAHNTLKAESVYRHFVAAQASQWNGEDVDGTILKTSIPDDRWDHKTQQQIKGETPDTKVQEVFLKRTYRGAADTWTLQQNWATEVDVFENTKIIELDTPTKWKVKVEYFLSQLQQDPAQAYHNRHGRGVYIVAFVDDAEREKMVEKWHLDEWEIVQVSDLPDPPDNFKPSTGPKMTKTQKKKHTRKIFQLKDQFRTAPERKSDNWEHVDVDMDDDVDEKFFIEIESFFPILWGRRSNYGNVQFLISMVPELGLKVDEVYGLKPKAIEKVKDNKTWVRLDDRLTEEALAQKGVLLKAIAQEESLRQAPHSLKPYAEKTESFPKGSPMRELLEFYQSLSQKHKRQAVDEDLVKLLKMAGHNVKREAAQELDRLLDAVRGRYPLLSAFRIFPDGFHHHLAESQLNAVVQYIEIIERELVEDDEDDF